jgi:hypothetical protein
MRLSMNHNKVDEEKGPKNNIKNGLVISGLEPKRWNRQPSLFQNNLKLWKRH